MRSSCSGRSDVESVHEYASSSGHIKAGTNLQAPKTMLSSSRSLEDLLHWRRDAPAAENYHRCVGIARGRSGSRLGRDAGAACPKGRDLVLLPPPQTTEHSIDIRGRTLRYQARAGTLSLLASNADVTAEVFYVAYTLQPEKAPELGSQRPITFVFNGGPGAASAYLHLGAMGPRVIATAADGRFLPSPQKLVDNSDTWLDMTDLVFVDPVGTGYSREAPGREARSFWGVNQDAASMGAFVRPISRIPTGPVRRSSRRARAMAGSAPRCLPGRSRRTSASVRAASFSSRPRSNSCLCGPISSIRSIWCSSFPLSPPCACSTRASRVLRCGTA